MMCQYRRRALQKKTVLCNMCLIILLMGNAVGCWEQQTKAETGGEMKMDRERLKPCPDTPNCVVSDGGTGRHTIEPIVFDGTPEWAWEQFQDAVVETGGSIESVDTSYLHATYRSSLFRFIDDLTCRLDDDQRLIHIRSASRIGYYDFGVNRKRVEQIRRQFGNGNRRARQEE